MSESEQLSRPAGKRNTAANNLGRKITKPVVMVGLMGAGKTSIGRRLATRLGIPFVDADAEIEAAAGCTIEEIFEQHGESAFRDGERRVIARLLEGPPQVIATGGGAYMDESTRAIIRERAISLWLRADLDTLVSRTARRNNRPLLKAGEPKEVLDRLMHQRYPVYAEADITVDSQDCPPEQTTQIVLQALQEFLEREDRSPDNPTAEANTTP